MQDILDLTERAPSGPEPLFRVISRRELADAKQIEWLVEDTIPADGLVVLYGPPGVGKSFVAIDLAMHVVTGRPWAGAAVRQGVALYVMAEGSGGGLAQRVAAWEERHNGGEIVDSIHFVRQAIDLRASSSAEELTRVVVTHGVDLIIVDTLARCMNDADENSSRDMGVVIGRIAKLRQDTGVAVVVVHHSLKANNGVERGSSALPGAADTRISVRCSGDEGEYLGVSCEKQRDGARFADLTFEREAVGESCALRFMPLAINFSKARDLHDDSCGPAKGPTLSAKQKAMLALLEQAPEGLRHKDFLVHEIGSRSGITGALRKFSELGLAHQDPTTQRWHARSATARSEASSAACSPSLTEQNHAVARSEVQGGPLPLGRDLLNELNGDYVLDLTET